jgi:hypothetical protein
LLLNNNDYILINVIGVIGRVEMKMNRLSAVLDLKKRYQGIFAGRLAAGPVLRRNRGRKGRIDGSVRPLGGASGPARLLILE